MCPLTRARPGLCRAHSLATARHARTILSDPHAHRHLLLWQASEAGVPNQWLVVDLGAPGTLCSVRLLWAASGFALRYKIELSADGTRWMAAATVRRGQSGWQQLPITPRRIARWIRLSMDALSHEGGSYSLHELEAQGFVDEACTRNLALHRPVAASSDDASLPSINVAAADVDGGELGAEDADVESHLAASAVDGDGSTRWASAASEPEWLTVPLAQPVTRLCHVRIKWHSHAAARWSLATSADGQTWSTVLRVTSDHASPGAGGAAGWVQFEVQSPHTISGSTAGPAGRTQPGRHLVTVDGFEPRPAGVFLLGRPGGPSISSATSNASGAAAASSDVLVRYVRLVCERRAVQTPTSHFSVFELELYGIELLQSRPVAGLIIAARHSPPPAPLPPAVEDASAAASYVEREHTASEQPPPQYRYDDQSDRFADLLSSVDQEERFGGAGDEGRAIQGQDRQGAALLAARSMLMAVRAAALSMLLSGGPGSTVLAAALLAVLLVAIGWCCEARYSSRSLRAMRRMRERSSAHPSQSSRWRARLSGLRGPFHSPFGSTLSSLRRGDYTLSSLRRGGYHSVHAHEMDIELDAGSSSFAPPTTCHTTRAMTGERERAGWQGPPPPHEQEGAQRRAASRDLAASVGASGPPAQGHHGPRGGGAKRVSFSLGHNTYDDDGRAGARAALCASTRPALRESPRAGVAYTDACSEACSEAASAVSSCASSALSSTLVNNTLYVPVVVELDSGEQIPLSMDYNLDVHRGASDPNSLLLVGGLKRRLAELCMQQFGRLLPTDESLLLQAEMDSQGSLLTLTEATPLETYVDCRRLRALTARRYRQTLLMQAGGSAVHSASKPTMNATSSRLVAAPVYT